MRARLFLQGLAGVCAFLGFLSFFLASQLFWIRRLKRLGERFIPGAHWRERIGGAAAILYLLVFAYNLAWAHLSSDPTQLTWRAALLEAPFKVWLLGSVLGFILICFFWVCDRVVRAAYGLARRISKGNWTVGPESPTRRQFLEQTALLGASVPFVAGAYGALYGRTDLEIANRRIRLSRLPRSFEGFRIAQLSDFHIGPFMPADEIRRYVALTNRLKPDLVAVTGDFVTWDAGTQDAVVEVVSELKAPFGIYGCLGNHELWTDTEASILGYSIPASVLGTTVKFSALYGVLSLPGVQRNPAVHRVPIKLTVVGVVPHPDKTGTYIIAGRYKKQDTDETEVVAIRVNDRTLVLRQESEQVPPATVQGLQEGEEIVVEGDKSKRGVIRARGVRLAK